MEITPTRLNKLIRTIKKQINSQPELPPAGLIMPEYWRGEIDRKKYKGKGRPRKDDYEMIHYREYFKGSGFKS